MQRGWDVTHLVSILPADPASMLYHVPNLHLTPLLAEAMGIPLVQERSDPGEDAELGARRPGRPPAAGGGSSGRPRSGRGPPASGAWTRLASVWWSRSAHLRNQKNRGAGRP